jgi:hypothetical protein
MGEGERWKNNANVVHFYGTILNYNVCREVPAGIFRGCGAVCGGYSFGVRGWFFMFVSASSWLRISFRTSIYHPFLLFSD